MKILLTGGAGFIGSHLADYMLSIGHNVTVLDRLDVAARLGHLSSAAAYGDRFTFRWHDLKAPIPEDWPRDYDWILHLAASSHVDRSVQNPSSFVMDNVLGTAHVLDFARTQRNLHRVLVFSTDEVFGPADSGECFDDHARHWPNNPYAASKSAAEQLCPAYANTYGLPIVVTHGANFYGPRQHAEKAIPLFRRQILDGATVQIHARNGVSSSRCYTHVRDACRAVEVVLARGGVIGSQDTGRYNISDEHEYTNLQVAQDIAAHLKLPVKYELVEFVANRPKHDQRYAVSANRLRGVGWAPGVTWEEGLSSTLDWYAAQEA